jgi:predicted lipoprotein with Yx(FWY)xxD motif
MSSVFRALLSTTAVVAISAYGSMAAAQAPVKTTDGVLTNTSGMTLYTFDKDTADKSACNGPCARNWVPLAAAPDAKASGDWSLVTRDDGSTQWAFKGKPLYTWSKDAKPGDKSGDDFNNAWHVAKAPEVKHDDDVVITGSRLPRHSASTSGSVQSSDGRNAVGGIMPPTSGAMTSH